MPTTVSLEITVTKPDGTDATGQLDVDTSVTPKTGTFTPDGNGGVSTDVSPVTWTPNDNGTVGWNFTVGDSGNGDFPAKNGNEYTYRFTGTQHADGEPTGNVNWPSSSIDADPDVTWQSGSTAEEEPFAAGKGAS